MPMLHLPGLEPKFCRSGLIFFLENSEIFSILPLFIWLDKAGNPSIRFSLFSFLKKERSQKLEIGNHMIRKLAGCIGRFFCLQREKCFYRQTDLGWYPELVLLSVVFSNCTVFVVLFPITSVFDTLFALL